MYEEQKWEAFPETSLSKISAMQSKGDLVLFFYHVKFILFSFSISSLDPNNLNIFFRSRDISVATLEIHVRGDKFSVAGTAFFYKLKQSRLKHLCEEM